MNKNVSAGPTWAPGVVMAAVGAVMLPGIWLALPYARANVPLRYLLVATMAWVLFSVVLGWVSQSSGGVSNAE